MMLPVFSSNTIVTATGQRKATNLHATLQLAGERLHEGRLSSARRPEQQRQPRLRAHVNLLSGPTGKLQHERQASARRGYDCAQLYAAYRLQHPRHVLQDIDLRLVPKPDADLRQQKFCSIAVGIKHLKLTENL